MVQRAGAGEIGLPIGSDYFNKNFQVEENKTKMRNIHPRFFICFFRVKIRVWVRVRFGDSFRVSIFLSSG